MVNFFDGGCESAHRGDRRTTNIHSTPSRGGHEQLKHKDINCGVVEKMRILGPNMVVGFAWTLCLGQFRAD